MIHGSDLPNGCGLVTSGGFKDTTKAQSTHTGNMVHLMQP